MAHVFTFVTKRFDPAKEMANEINPIAGEGVLNWLRQELKAHGLELSAPATEDWGWYCDLEHGGAKYMVGASGEPEDGNPDVGWTVQLDKHRTMKEKLFGRNKLSDDDYVSMAVERLVKKQPDFRDVTIDRK